MFETTKQIKMDDSGYPNFRTPRSFQATNSSTMRSRMAITLKCISPWYRLFILSGKGQNQKVGYTEASNLGSMIQYDSIYQHAQRWKKCGILKHKHPTAKCQTS